jgi:hypothetical protein
LVLPHPNEAIPAKSRPKGEQRSQVPRALLERTIQDLHQYVQGYVGDWVLNLDEVCISDGEDRQIKKVIVPAAMLGPTIHHGVSRNVKHISLIARMLTAGESLLHDFVTWQNS